MPVRCPGLVIVASLVLLPGCKLLGGGSGKGTSSGAKGNSGSCPEASGERASLVAVPFLLRTAIQDSAKSGLVPVRFNKAGCGAELEVVADCRVHGRYIWRGKQSGRAVVMRTLAQLQSRLTLSASALEARLKASGALRVEERVAGAFKAAKGSRYDRSRLRGTGCAQATHVLSAIEVGGYSVISGPAAALDALKDGFAGLSKGAKGLSEVSRAGDAKSCDKASRAAAPRGCNQPLAVRLARVQAADETQDEAPMVLISAGPNQDPPQPQAQLAEFSIDRHEVTTEQYARCVQDKKCAPAHDGPGCNRGKLGRESHPINCVRFTDAQKYCKWAGKRLPSQAEWARAARGASGASYPWGSAWPPPAGAGNFADRSAQQGHPNWAKVPGYEDGYATTAPVGSFGGARSPEGLHDVAGNVAEWTSDPFVVPGRRRSRRAPGARVVRGSSFGHGRAEQVQLGRVTGYLEATRSQHVGFRCALTGPDASGTR